jgi:hypothetical protein
MRRHRREMERRMRERTSRTVRFWERKNLNKENRKEEFMRGCADRARGLRLGEVRGEWTRIMRCMFEILDMRRIGMKR